MTISVIELGDPSVGLSDVQYKVDCPFNLDDVDKESLEYFRERIKALYREFSDQKVTAIYDFETI